jgi:hypothetical protein
MSTRLGSATGCERGQRPHRRVGECTLVVGAVEVAPVPAAGKVTRKCSDRSGGHVGTTAGARRRAEAAAAQPTRASAAAAAPSRPGDHVQTRPGTPDRAARAAHVVADADERAERARPRTESAPSTPTRRRRRRRSTGRRRARRTSSRRRPRRCRCRCGCAMRRLARAARSRRRCSGWLKPQPTTK